jgi:hypothetical protein
MRESAQRHTDAYFKELEKIKQDPTHISDIHGTHMDNASIGYLTFLGKNLSISWLCRSLDCGYYGYNHQWVKATSEHFRCPSCGVEYRPWSSCLHNKKPAFPAQKCVSYVNDNNEVVAFPAVWPWNTADSWLSKMIEDRAVHVGEVDPEDVSVFATRNLREIDRILKKSARTHLFKQLQWKQEVEDKLDVARFPRANWAHLKESGFQGNFLNLKDPELEPFENRDELIALFANILSLGRQLARL